MTDIDVLTYQVDYDVQVGWGLPKDEYQLICDTFSAEVRGLTRIPDRREDLS
jgi:hypothetical protein